LILLKKSLFIKSYWILTIVEGSCCGLKYIEAQGYKKVTVKGLGYQAPFFVKNKSSV